MSGGSDNLVLGGLISLLVSSTSLNNIWELQEGESVEQYLLLAGVRWSLWKTMVECVFNNSLAKSPKVSQGACLSSGLEASSEGGI